MSIFNERITFGLIKELGEDSVLLLVGGQDVEVELQNEAKKTIFSNAEQGIMIVPFDLDNKLIVLDTKQSAIYEA